MADTISILVPEGFAAPTEEDIREAKRWTLSRNGNADRLASLVESLLEDAVAKMTRIGYRYNVRPEDFEFSADKRLREEVAQVLNDLEEAIMELIEEYSLNESDGERRHAMLLPWLLALHSKGASDLQGTLRIRLRQLMMDTEAQIAAMLMAGHKLTVAITRIISTMHAVYTAPEVQAAYKRHPKATYLQSHGVHYGNVGLSNSGANNVENLARQTAIQAWARSRLMEMEDGGARGYWVSRGSTFPCAAICDQQVGFHYIDDADGFPPYHGHCCCFAVPMYLKLS